MKLGLPTVLFLIFMILKLTHQLTWSWLWVASPLWIGIPAVFVLVFGFLVLAAMVNHAN